MLNNKGYVFAPMMLLLLIILVIVIYSFRGSFLNSVNQASSLQGVMDNYYYNYSKELIVFINNFKVVSYNNLSNSLLVPFFNSSVNGVIISDSSVIPLLVPFKEFTGDVNVSFNSSFVNVAINYPIASLLTAENSFSVYSVQDCLNAHYCSSNRAFDSILMDCLSINTPGGFNIKNLTVPQLIGNVINVNLSFYSNGMTLVYPFILGSNPYSFNC